MSSTRSPSRRSLRRPIPPLIFLLLLALIALGVWWKVLGQAEEREAADAPRSCATSTSAPASVDPTAVEVRVYNASSIEGLAAQVSNELRGRGLTVSRTANDPSDRLVEGVGEIRYGVNGAGQALYVAANFPGLVRVPDDRPGPVVDVALGPGYAGLVPAEEVPAAYATAMSAAASSAAASC